MLSFRDEVIQAFNATPLPTQMKPDWIDPGYGPRTETDYLSTVLGVYGTLIMKIRKAIRADQASVPTSEIFGYCTPKSWQ
jgi:hypothetical protein